MTKIHFRSLTATLGTQIVLIAIAALFAACSDGPTAPKPGSIRFTVTTTGGDPDVDGFQVVVDSEPVGSVQLNATMVIPNLTAAPHTVDLNGIADNCSILGAHPVTVAVAGGDTVTAAFNIVCDATGIRATVQVTGEDKPDQLQVQVGSYPAGTLPVNGQYVLSRLPAGTYTVRVIGATSNCTVTTNPVTVEVTNRSLAAVAFQLACVAIPRTGKIAFVRYGNITAAIALVNPDGSGLVSMAPGTGPAWSPDGKRLLFTTRVCEYYGYYCSGGIVLMDAETLVRQNLPYVGFSPVMSPDGLRIAFTSDYGHLVIGSADGTAAPLDLAIGNVVYVWHPSWSPDSEHIVFSCYWGQAQSFQSDICIVKSDGTGLQLLTNDTPSDSNPAWSPDGTTIAFETNRYDQHVEIATVAAAGGAITRVIPGSNPAWSPESSALVFAGADGLYTVLPNGSNAQRVTTGSHYEPAWRQ